MKLDCEKVIRKYFIACIILGIVLVSLWIAICLNIRSYIWEIVSLLILLCLTRFAILIIGKSIILPILFNDLEGQTFHEIITDKRFVPPLTYRISAALSIGDYQTVINITTMLLRKKQCSITAKYYYLGILARAYFELRDFEKLQVLVAKYEEYKERYPSKAFLRTPNSVWSYYQYFLEHNYEMCKTVCKERNLALKPKMWDFKFRKLQNDFYYAVACYANEEIEVAKETFDSVIIAAPHMYLSSVSQRYVETMKQNQPLLLSDIQVVPDESYQIHDERTVAKMHRKKIITFIGIIVAVALITTTSVLDHINEKDNGEISIFESKLDDALIEYYGAATRIDHFSVEKESVYVDSLCLAYTSNKLVLVEVISYDDEETIDILVVKESVEIDSYYCVKGPASDYYIGFWISKNENKDDDFYYMAKFEIKGITYWLNVDYVETYPNESDNQTGPSC